MMQTLSNHREVLGGKRSETRTCDSMEFDQPLAPEMFGRLALSVHALTHVHTGVAVENFTASDDSLFLYIASDQQEHK